MARARSTMRTGSPMSSTNTSAPGLGAIRRAASRPPDGSPFSAGRGSPISEPERMISWTASGIVMK